MSSFAATPAQPALPARLRAAAADIKLAHSVFALPFAIFAAFLARPADPSFPGGSWPGFFGQLVLVILCMVFARTWAMLINRLADRRFDALNPRTARRALPSGRLSPRDAAVLTLTAAIAFLIACSLFGFFFANWWPALLGAPVLAWIALYSFTKRFTALCHVFLGGALAVSPLAAALAVNPAALAEFPGRGIVLLLLAGFVLFWVAGFDVIYALQDLDFDRAAGLRSIPARVGPRAAIWISRILHAGAFTLLATAAIGRSDPRLGLPFTVAVAAVGLLLIVEHTILARRGKAGLEMAFFTVNGIVSCVLGAAGVADLLC